MRTHLVLLSLVALTAGCTGGGSGGGGGCDDPGNGPTLHSGDVVGTETWLADDSPHIVESTVNVRDGASLIIEPCAEVLLAAGAAINVAYPITPNTGSLIAEGTSSKPIRFAGQDGARWAHLFVNTPGTMSLAHVTIEGGGSDAFASNASLVAYGSSVTPTAHDLYVEEVTITGSLGAGVLLARATAFVEGSRELVVSDSGNTDHPYPIEAGEHSLHTLPDGEYTGNLRDEILVVPEGANSTPGLQESVTMRDLGVPYHVGTPTSSSGSGLRIGGGGPLAVLTIEAGVVIRFEPGLDLSLEVEHFTGEFAASGEIRALGTADDPVVFTSAADVPAAGDWMGLWFGGQPGSGNVLDHVRVEYAGAECLCILATCSAESESEGAIIITNEPPSSFLTNSVIAHSASHGVSRAWQGATVDFAATNTFEDIATCDQTLNIPTDGDCPGPPPPSCL